MCLFIKLPRSSVSQVLVLLVIFCGGKHIKSYSPDFLYKLKKSNCGTRAKYPWPLYIKLSDPTTAQRLLGAKQMNG